MLFFFVFHLFSFPLPMDAIRVHLAEAQRVLTGADYQTSGLRFERAELGTPAWQAFVARCGHTPLLREGMSIRLSS